MMFLTAAAVKEPDYIALALVLGIFAAFAVYALCRNARRKRAQAAAAVEVTAVEAVPAPEAPGSAGQLKIYDVPPKTAAMLMAIVADQMGKPLNELRFISIKEVKES